MGRRLWIKKGKTQGSYCEIVEFKEKPDEKTAQFYFQSSQYAWNSGMYIFSARTMANELRQHAPDIYSLMTLNYNTFLEKFPDLPEVSIDYAISEKSNKLIMFEGSFGWSDIGSFDALAEITQNTNSAKHVSIDSENIFVHSANNRLIATLGVKDLVIVDNNDSILIKKRGKSEDVRKIVKHLKNSKAKELDHQKISLRVLGLC